MPVLPTYPLISTKMLEKLQLFFLNRRDWNWMPSRIRVRVEG